ncbi:MAG TPA: GNAT family N-acetyltransferase [Gammaproteobacteria bacterium]|nr:GNAT family N-acetyltransferase [Gammaproteobacteria bacterium]
MTKLIAHTERLVLRQMEPADALFLCRLLNEPSWLQNIGDKGVRTPQDADAYIRTNFVGVYRVLGFGMYLVESRKQARPMGVCGLVKRNGLPHPDIGFGFMPEFRGRGYAFEAASAVVEHARALGFEKLLGIAKSTNCPSIKLLEKLGFRSEGLTRLATSAESLRLYGVELK